MPSQSPLGLRELLGISTTVGGVADAYDVLLEAVSYLHDGAWNGFENAVEAVGATLDHDLVARDCARVLSALGHIDVAFNQRTVRAETWTVAPPVLLRLTDSEWLLCGKRPTRLVAALVAGAQACGVHARIEATPGQPARITVHGAPLERALVVVEAVRANDVSLELNPHGAASLAHALPTLHDVVNDLHRAQPSVGGSIQRLEIGAHGHLEWTPVVDFSSPGAYRFDPPPTTYVLVDAEGAVPAHIDARMARLLAHINSGMAPLSWDPDTGIARAARCAEPPALFERALALSSGFGPQPNVREWVTEYRGVGEEVAAAVHARLLSN